VAAPGAPLAAGVAPAPAQPPAAFGGHRGGGKKRLDGLTAGSEEAKAADREKDKLRMAAKRAATKAAALPPVLPSSGSPVDGALVAAAAPAGGAAGVSPVESAPFLGAGAALVLWSRAMLERPMKLAVRIGDRLRIAALCKRLDASPVPVAVRDEVKKSLALADALKADLGSALGNALAIELNKRNVSGAQHSHWLDVGMLGAEVVNAHLQTMEKIEELILASATAGEKASNHRGTENTEGKP
jgi:hypothetical protein